MVSPARMRPDINSGEQWQNLSCHREGSLESQARERRPRTHWKAALKVAGGPTTEWWPAIRSGPIERH